MFGIGPAYLFLVQHRLPVGLMREGWTPWLSTMLTNAAIAVVVAGLMWLVGVGPFLIVHLPIMLLAASIGVWLFYVQHQFEDTVWAKDRTWNLHEVALRLKQSELSFRFAMEVRNKLVEEKYQAQRTEFLDKLRVRTMVQSINLLQPAGAPIAIQPAKSKGAAGGL